MQLGVKRIGALGNTPIAEPCSHCILYNSIKEYEQVFDKSIRRKIIIKLLDYVFRNCIY